MKFKPDPMGQPRNGLVIYLLVIAVMSGLGFLSGTPTAGSIEAELPPLARYAWGAMLTVGAAGALTGMFWPGDPRTGLLVKRFGFVSLVFAALVYGTVLWASAGVRAFLVWGSVYGFAMACAERAWRVDQMIKRVIQETP